MKIAFFSDAFLDTIGGIRTAIVNQKAELEKRGHTVYLFSTGYRRSKTELKRLAKEHIYVVPSCKVFFKGLAPISRRPGIIEKWLQKNFPELEDFNIFYVHYEGGCSIAGLRLARQLQIPSIQVMHGREDVGEVNIIPFGFRTFVAFMLNWFHSWYLPHPTKIKRDNYLATSTARAKMWTLMVNHANSADLVLVPTRHFKTKLKHYGVQKTLKILPNGFADELFLPEVPIKHFKHKEKLRIIWHSRVSAEKRIMPFLQALKNVNHPYHLDVYGGGGDFFRAKRFVRRHQMDVTFYGNAKFTQIYAKLQKAHLDVLVSYNFDTFGTTLIEAESVGVPVLICDPDLKEVVPSGGFILAKDITSSSMTEAINSIFSHPEIISQMSQKMLKHRSQILVSKKVDILEQYFRDIIKP